MAKKNCPYCTSTNDAFRGTYFDQTCLGCVRRMANPICKCECGGNVRGVREFGQWWTWCDRCTPVETVQMPLPVAVNATVGGSTEK